MRPHGPDLAEKGCEGNPRWAEKRTHESLPRPSTAIPVHELGDGRPLESSRLKGIHAKPWNGTGHLTELPHLLESVEVDGIPWNQARMKNEAQTFLCVLAAALAVSWAPVQQTCSSCQEGICMDSPPRTVPMTPPNPGGLPTVFHNDQTLVWKQQGIQWCLYRRTTYCLVLIYKDCDLKDIEIWEPIGYKDEPVSPPNCYTPTPGADPLAGNPLRNSCCNSPGPDGVPTPGGPEISGWNCHGYSLGFTPGSPKLPTTPVTPAPYMPPGTTPITPRGSAGGHANNPGPITGSSAYSLMVEGCPEPPPPGTVVMVYEVPTGKDGKPDQSKRKAVHSATSNGDGTYKTKNGNTAAKPNASKAEAIDTYVNNKPAGTTRITVSYQKVP